MNTLAYKLSWLCERIGMWFIHTSQDLQWWADHRQENSTDG